jgi:hypothetical protein
MEEVRLAIKLDKQRPHTIISLKWPVHVNGHSHTVVQAETLEFYINGTYRVYRVGSHGSFVDLVHPVTLTIKEDSIVARQYVDPPHNYGKAVQLELM